MTKKEPYRISVNLHYEIHGEIIEFLKTLNRTQRSEWLRYAAQIRYYMDAKVMDVAPEIIEEIHQKNIAVVNPIIATDRPLDISIRQSQSPPHERISEHHETPGEYPAEIQRNNPEKEGDVFSEEPVSEEEEEEEVFFSEEEGLPDDLREKLMGLFTPRK